MFLKIAALAGLIAVAATAGAFAAPYAGSRGGAGGDALGIFLGQPTGITYRHGLGSAHSLEAKAAWDFASRNGASIFLQANWLFEFPGVLVIEEEDFPLYTGVGLQIGVGATTSLGFRVPMGLIYRFAKAPIELCLELGLGMQLFPSTALIGSGGIGVRYRF